MILICTSNNDQQVLLKRELVSEVRDRMGRGSTVVMTNGAEYPTDIPFAEMFSVVVGINAYHDLT